MNILLPNYCQHFIVMSFLRNKDIIVNEQVCKVEVTQNDANLCTLYRGNTATVEPQETGIIGWSAVRVALNGSMSVVSPRDLWPCPSSLATHSGSLSVFTATVAVSV